MSNWLTPITLRHPQVELVPLIFEHRAALLAAAADGALWQLFYTSVPSEQNIDSYLQTAFAEQAAGRALPFVVIHRESGKIVGCTRYCNATPQHRRLEIGYTWYAKSYQRTGLNTICKYLLLQHAFEHLNAIAVEFKTNWHNRPSRTAIARLGAKQEGVIRNHRINPDGTYRDTVLFSILEGEWGSVKQALTLMMK